MSHKVRMNFIYIETKSYVKNAKCVIIIIPYGSIKCYVSKGFPFLVKYINLIPVSVLLPPTFLTRYNLKSVQEFEHLEPSSLYRYTGHLCELICWKFQNSP